MKKFLTIVAGFILVGIAFTVIGPMILLGLGAALTYYSVRSFIKSPSLLGKLGWGIVGIAGLSMVFKSMPALIVIAAIAFLYYGYRQWKRKKSYKAPSSSAEYTTDFKDFENDWEGIMSKHK